MLLSGMLERGRRREDILHIVPDGIHPAEAVVYLILAGR